MKLPLDPGEVTRNEVMLLMPVLEEYRMATHNLLMDSNGNLLALLAYVYRMGKNEAITKDVSR